MRGAVGCFSQVPGVLLGVFGYGAILSLHMFGLVMFVVGLIGMFGDQFATAAGLFVTGCLFLWLGRAAVRFIRTEAEREELRQRMRAQEIADDIE